MSLGTIMAKKYLTNEKLKGIFKNNFELANEAIAYARAHIHEQNDQNLDDLLAAITRYVLEKQSEKTDTE